MHCNLSKTDRVARFIVGMGLLGVGGIYYRSWWGLLGLPLLFNAAMGVCGLYRLLGISTFKRCPDK